jgi:hypothetical protein
MSQPSTLRPRREPWKRQATERAEHQRSRRKARARIKHERDRSQPAHHETQERLRRHEAHAHGLVVHHQGELVWLALRLFGEVRISLRAVARGLRLLAEGCGITQAPWPQTVIHWLTRLARVRSAAARARRGLPLRAAPCSHGRIWRSARRMGLGAGTMFAVVAMDAHHPHLTPGAPSLEHARCLGVSVADAGTGDTSAEFLGRLLARGGRPAASLKDGGGELRNAVACLEEHGLGSPGLAERAHAVAALRKRSSQDHPACETFGSACGRVSGHVTQTILACWAPPTGRPTARLMPVHRLCTWADRVLPLSPSGGAKTGAPRAQWRAGLEPLPAGTALLTRLRGDASGLLACQPMVKRPGLSHATLAPCEPRLATMPSAALRRACRASLVSQVATATTLGRDHLGVPISSDAIAALCGVAKRQGMGETQDARRLALRLPAFGGVPTREEAPQVLEGRVARQHECTGPVTSLTKQRREVLGHPEWLERLRLTPDDRRMACLPPSKNRSNYQEVINISNGYRTLSRPQITGLDAPLLLENAAPPGIRELALTS